MSAKTRIKHLTSSGVSAPTILKTGELGYSYGTGTQANGGDRLYIGIGAEDGSGIATEIVKIGGQYLNKIDHFDCAFNQEKLDPGNEANNYGKYTGSMSNHESVYENVYNVLHGKGNIVTSGFDGYRTVKLIEDIYSKCDF